MKQGEAEHLMQWVLTILLLLFLAAAAYYILRLGK